jgi:hypothetical protein
VDAALQAALSLGEPGAWTAIAPNGDALVTFRAVSREEIGVHPYGQLSVRQQAVPLGIPITRIGRSHVRGGTATVTVAPIGGAPASAPTIGRFAIAEFQDLSDDEKLSRPSFESFQDGVAFGAAATRRSQQQKTTASYETVFIPDEQRRTDALHSKLLLHAVDFGAIARAGLHVAALYDGPDQQVRLADQAYRVASAETLGASAAAPGAFGSATAAFAAAGRADGRLVVVEAHEVLT